MNKEEWFKFIKNAKFQANVTMFGRTVVLDAVPVDSLNEEIKKNTKPVVVKQFVADWFEKNKDDLDFAIYAAVAHSIKESDYYRYPEGFIEWIELADNKPIETIIRMKDGYEVEKEPLYQIELPGTSWGAYLTKADNGDLVIFQNTTSGSAFTESEIKEIDERYWAFAVPVEVDEN